jgi:gelsolin
MLKPKEYKLDETNAAKLGSDEDRATKKKSAQTEPAWKGAGQKVGLEIWRIEKFKVKLWPKDLYGSFYSGDSYICLNTYKEQGKDALKWDLHFWLGEHTSQDEAGTAAYKTVELDTLLDDGPVQHREVQGYESELFLSYFKSMGSIRIMEGGVDSGFKHVEPEKYTPRLLHLKGTKKVRTTEVPLKVESLNSGDVFILDNGLNIYKWEGKQAGMFEKNKGREVCDAIKTERKAKAVVHNIREGDKDADTQEFFKLLGGTPDSKIKTAEEGGADNDAQMIAACAAVRQLWKVSDASGKMEYTKIAEGNNIKKSQLDPNDVFIFDSGIELFVWVGKGASDKERFESMTAGQNYLNKTGRPKQLPMSRIIDGGENPKFREAFGY